MKKALLAATVAIALPATAHAAGSSTFTSYTLSTAVYTQDFDSLDATGTSSSLPDGFQIVEPDSGSRANGEYTANDGGSNAGDIYSYGADGSAERALGSLASGSNDTLYFGGVFTNALGSEITELLFDYTGEQWRSGSASFDTLAFEFSTDATDLTVGNWTSVSALDFIAPNNSGGGSLNGNDANNQVDISHIISGLSIADGSTFGFRWYDTNNGGSDHGMAVDNLSITAVSAAIPEPASWAMMILGLGFAGGALRRKPAMKSVLA